MYRSRKRLTLLLLIFLITIMSGAVYAYTSGRLILTGGITYRRGITELSFIEHTSYAVSESGNGWGRYTIDPTGQIMTFEIYLAEPGDVVTLRYYVMNTGTTNVEILSMSASPQGFRGITGHHIVGDMASPIRQGTIFAPNAVSRVCEIQFRWDSLDVEEGATSFTINFELRINYLLTSNPANLSP